MRHLLPHWRWWVDAKSARFANVAISFVTDIWRHCTAENYHQPVKGVIKNREINIIQLNNISMVVTLDGFRLLFLSLCALSLWIGLARDLLPALRLYRATQICRHDLSWFRKTITLGFNRRIRPQSYRTLWSSEILAYSQFQTKVKHSSSVSD